MSRRISRRRRRKIFALTVLVVLLLVTAFVAIVLIQLPSLRDLHAQFIPIQRPIRAPASAADTGSTSATSIPAQSIARSPTPATDTGTNSITDYLTDRFIEQGSSDVRVCENLATMQSPPITSRRSLTTSFEQLATGEQIANPFPEAVLAPIGYILRRPSVSQLTQQLIAVREIGSDRFLDKADFYGLLALATADIFANKSTLERIAQQSYHLYVIARVVQLRPEFATNPDTLSLCDQIEASIENAQTETQTNTQSTPAPVDMNPEKAAILRFIAAAGLAPQQVAYDPNQQQTVLFSAAPRRLILKIPWMERSFGGLPEIGTAIEVEAPLSSPSPVENPGS